MDESIRNAERLIAAANTALARMRNDTSDDDFLRMVGGGEDGGEKKSKPVLGLDEDCFGSFLDIPEKIPATGEFQGYGSSHRENSIDEINNKIEAYKQELFEREQRKPLEPRRINRDERGTNRSRECAVPAAKTVSDTNLSRKSVSKPEVSNITEDLKCKILQTQEIVDRGIQTAREISETVNTFKARPLRTSRFDEISLAKSRSSEKLRKSESKSTVKSVDVKKCKKCNGEIAAKKSGTKKPEENVLVTRVRGRDSDPPRKSKNLQFQQLPSLNIQGDLICQKIPSVDILPGRREYLPVRTNTALETYSHEQVLSNRIDRVLDEIKKWNSLTRDIGRRSNMECSNCGIVMTVRNRSVDSEQIDELLRMCDYNVFDPRIDEFVESCRVRKEEVKFTQTEEEPVPEPKQQFRAQVPAEESPVVERQPKITDLSKELTRKYREKAEELEAEHLEFESILRDVFEKVDESRDLFTNCEYLNRMTKGEKREVSLTVTKPILLSYSGSVEEIDDYNKVSMRPKRPQKHKMSSKEIRKRLEVKELRTNCKVLTSVSPVKESGREKVVAEIPEREVTISSPECRTRKDLPNGYEVSVEHKKPSDGPDSNVVEEAGPIAVEPKQGRAPVFVELEEETVKHSNTGSEYESDFEEESVDEVPVAVEKDADVETNRLPTIAEVDSDINRDDAGVDKSEVHVTPDAQAVPGGAVEHGGVSEVKPVLNKTSPDSPNVSEDDTERLLKQVNKDLEEVASLSGRRIGAVKCVPDHAAEPLKQVLDALKNQFQRTELLADKLTESIREVKKTEDPVEMCRRRDIILNLRKARKAAEGPRPSGKADLLDSLHAKSPEEDLASGQSSGELVVSGGRGRGLAADDASTAESVRKFTDKSYSEGEISELEVLGSGRSSPSVGEDQNASPWSWNQGGSQSYPPSTQSYPPTYSTTSSDQSQMMAGYQQMYAGTTPQQAPDYGASQWNMAQFQHWQQWQQWQEKYQQWQAQYGKKYAESLAAMGQNPNVMLPSVPAVCGVVKPCEMVPNPGYTTVNPPPPPCNAQPVPPPPPEEEKPISGENPEELSEAEKTFDIQFKQWEDQFNEWKKQNQDHPDKAQYREYEKKWETWREQLLQRREQMRKKRLSKTTEGVKDPKNLGKNEESKGKGDQDKNLIQMKGETGSIASAGEAHNPSDQQSVGPAPFGRDENEGVFLQERPRDDNLLPNPNFPEGSYNPFGDNRMHGYFDRDMNYANQPFGPGVLDRNNPKFGTEGNRDRFGMGSRMDNWNRGEFFHRRPYGNGNFEDERNLWPRFGNMEEGRNFGARFGSAEENRNFGSRFASAEEARNFGPRFSNLEDERNFPPRFGNVEDERNFPPRFGNVEDERIFGLRFGNVDGRKSSQDRFRDAGHKDGKYNPGRESGPIAQSIEQAFSQAPRKYPERNFAADMKAPFSRAPPKINAGNSFKSRVPSLFDITVERPPGLRSPGKDRKPKIWEQDNFDGGEKDDKNVPRQEGPWLLNPAWVHNNSPWIKPWELGRVVGESADKNFRSDAWQKEPRRGVRNDDKTLSKEIRKSDVDNPEYPGYVGKMLTKFDNSNALPPNATDKNVPGFLGENAGKLDESMENKLKSFTAGTGETDIPNPDIFTEENQNYVQNFGRGPFEGSQAESDNRMDDLFGRDDCDERVRFERPNFNRDGRRGDRRFNDPGKRDVRDCPEEDKVPGNKSEDDRQTGKGEKNSSCDKTGGAFPTLEDVDERRMVNRDRRGRGFDDRDDRPFRGHVYDRDDRRNRGNFDRFGRNAVAGAKDVEWNPQVFDYSKGNKQGLRSQFPEPKDNFHISNVLDYSHGEKKQTFDYAHGESKTDKKLVVSFDYAHGAESRSVIDYGHGSDRDGKELLECKKEMEGDVTNEDGSRSRSKSPQRLRSPRAEQRSRSRSPIAGREKTAPDSDPPSFRNPRSKGGDRSGKQNARRNKRNNSQEKSEPGKDEDVSKNSFDVTTVLVEDLICSPGRESRPNKLVFIIRGLPGSGKTYVTKLIKDREVELGGDPPRILSLDDYFMTEVEKETTDEETGRKIKKKVLEYEYESCAEPHYRGSLLKAFKKTVSDGFFSFIIVDSVNEKTKDYEEMWSFAKQKGFQVYVAEMDDDVAVCTKRNIHKRTEKEISDLSAAWEKTPSHYLRLDVRSLLQADAITEVEMEVVSDTDPEKAAGAQKEKDAGEGEDEDGDGDGKEEEEEDEPGESAFVKSRWDHFENSEQKLDRLDGLKRRREGFHATMEDYLQLPEDIDAGSGEPTDGKKKVRWADLEERRQQEKMRAIGFVVGQTDWSRMTDPTFGESALTRTKYI